MIEYQLRRVAIIGGPMVVAGVIFFGLGTDVPGRFTGHDLLSLLFIGGFVALVAVDEYMVKTGRWKP